MFSTVAFPVVSYVFSLSHKQHDFREKVTEHKMCVLIFSTTFVWNISLYKKNWARYDRKCISVCCMWSTGYCCQVLMELEFPRQIFQKSPDMNFMKICPVGAELTVAFCNFPKVLIEKKTRSLAAFLLSDARAGKVGKKIYICNEKYFCESHYKVKVSRDRPRWP